MHNFKKYIKEGIGKNTGRRDLSRHRSQPAPSDYIQGTQYWTKRADAHVGGHRGILPHMMKAVPHINELTNHIFHKYLKNPGVGSSHPQDERYFNNYAKSDFTGYNNNNQHIGTVTLNDAIHPDDSMSQGGKFKHIKVHVVDHPTLHGANYIPIPHHDHNTNTIHTHINVNSENFNRPDYMMGYQDPISQVRDTLAHEVSHSLQHIVGAQGLISKVGSVSRGTDIAHSRLPTPHPSFPTDLSNRLVANAPELTPKQVKTREKIKKIGEKDPYSIYMHSGNEGQARVMGKLPTIMDAVTRHHASNDTHASIKNSVNRIKNESENFKSPHAARKFLHSNLSKLLDHHTKDFNKLVTRHMMNTGDYNDKKLMHDSRAITKPVKQRKQQLEAKQRKNILLLAQHANEHYVNDIIHQHSEHNVLATRESPEQLSHETQREIAIQKPNTRTQTQAPAAPNIGGPRLEIEIPKQKTTTNPQKIKPEVKPEVKPEIKPQETAPPKKSMLKRFKSFIGLK